MSRRTRARAPWLEQPPPARYWQPPRTSHDGRTVYLGSNQPRSIPIQPRLALPDPFGDDIDDPDHASESASVWTLISLIAVFVGTYYCWLLLWRFHS